MPKGNRYRNTIDQGRSRMARRFKRAGATREQLRHPGVISRATGDAGFAALDRSSRGQVGMRPATLQEHLDYATSGESGLPKSARALPMRVKGNPRKMSSSDPGRRGPRAKKSTGLRGRIEGVLRRMLSLPRKKGK